MPDTFEQAVKSLVARSYRRCPCVGCWARRLCHVVDRMGYRLSVSRMGPNVAEDLVRGGAGSIIDAWFNSSKFKRRRLIPRDLLTSIRLVVSAPE